MLTKTIVFISIGGFLLWVLLTPATAAPTRKERRASEKQGHTHRTPDTLLDFQNSNFYRTIIDNNLFRPLGWQPTPPRSPYRLIGTKLVRDADSPPQAILQSTTGHQTYIVTLGERLAADTEVVDIQPKQVTLSTNGRTWTLKLNTAVFLNPNRSPRRTTDTPMRPRTAAPIRPQTPMRRPTAVTATHPTNRHPSPLLEWAIREGLPIPFGDARLEKNKKW